MIAKYACYLVVDDSLCPIEKMFASIAALIECGVTCIQLRMKLTPAAQVIHLIDQLLPLTKANNIPLILNDVVNIAKQMDVYGVHLGQTDMPVMKAREILGPHKIIGLSIENLDQAILFKNAEVNYFGVGPVYATTTKRDAARPLGIVQLQKIVKVLAKPVVAIGGIQENNLNDVLTTDVAGVALVSAIWCAKDPISKTKQLAQIIQQSFMSSPRPFMSAPRPFMSSPRKRGSPSIEEISHDTKN